MTSFDIVHQERLEGKLTCFDRMILKGHVRGLYPDGAFKAFLDREGVLLKDFGTYVHARTQELKAHVKEMAESAGRPYIYLGQAHTKARGNGKEDMARGIAERDGVREGLICVLGAVENCRSFDVFKNKETKRLEIVRRTRKCLHYYFYLIDPELGFCHLRLQSWAPYELQIWINGREVLSRALDKKGVAHSRYANAIVACEGWDKAQALADKLARRRWPRLLNALARRVNPLLVRIGKAGFGGYWWVADQVEVATDVAFASREALEEILPGLFTHATSTFSATDVLRFLGRKLHPSLQKEVTSSTRARPEGWRVKHSMGSNSIKVYDKANVLRVETTINDPSEFRVLRTVEGSGMHRQRCWRPMRKGVANLPRHHQVGRGANERYLEALAAASDNGEGVQALDDLCRPSARGGRHVSAFNPVARFELALFKAVLPGEHAIVGFRNADITRRLYPHPPDSTVETRRRSARSSRLIAKLRGHGLVAKVKDQRLYRITPRGQRIMSAALSVHDRQFPAAYATAS